MMTIDRAEVYRYNEHPQLPKTKTGDPFGFFLVPSPFSKKMMAVMVSPTDSEWQHVSVSLQNRTPSWAEMCHIKNLFWEEEDCVIQFHPPKSEYVNRHPFCLHLWCNTKAPTPPPPRWMV